MLGLQQWHLGAERAGSQPQKWTSASTTILSDSRPHRGVLRHALYLEGWSDGQTPRKSIWKVMLEKAAVTGRCCSSLGSVTSELPFIQMLTLHDACLVYTAEDSGRFLMIYHSLRSHNPVLTLWLLLGFASPTKYLFCVTQGEKPIRRMKIGLMCLQKMSKQH